MLRYCEDAIKDSMKERTSLTVTSLLACIVIKEEEEEEEMVAARATLRMRFYSRYYVYCIIVQKDRNKERERDMYVYVVRGVRGLTRSPRVYRNFLLSFLQLSIWIDRQVLNNTVTNAVNVLNREKEEDTGIRILNKRRKKRYNNNK